MRWHHEETGEDYNAHYAMYTLHRDVRKTGTLYRP
jgi:hypothetical protein